MMVFTMRAHDDAGNDILPGDDLIFVFFSTNSCLDPIDNCFLTNCATLLRRKADEAHGDCKIYGWLAERSRFSLI